MNIKCVINIKYLMILFIIILIFNTTILSDDFFSDVPPDHWAYKALKYLYSLGIIEGYNDNTFRGNKPITRYEMALLIYKLLIYLEEKYGIELSKNGKISTDIAEISNKSPLTKKDAELLIKLVNEFKEELNNINKRLDLLEKRVSALENDKTPIILSSIAIVISVLSLIFNLIK